MVSDPSSAHGYVCVGGGLLSLASPLSLPLFLPLIEICTLKLSQKVAFYLWEGFFLIFNLIEFSVSMCTRMDTHMP